MYLKIPKDCFVKQYKETAFGYGGVFRFNVEHYSKAVNHEQ